MTPPARSLNQAWREANELEGRDLMRGGQWVGAGAPIETEQAPVASVQIEPTQCGLRFIGMVRSSLTDRDAAPKQGVEGAPDAVIELNPSVLDGLDGLAVGDEVIVITWLHQARLDILKAHPRSDDSQPLTGVFATRSPDRPNPLGLHPVTVSAIAGTRLTVGPLEAIDGTPVVDIKPVLRS